MATTEGPLVRLVGGRVHASHGPIDLLITIDGPAGARIGAIGRLQVVFAGLLDELVLDLPGLRAPAGTLAVGTGATAQRMIAAVEPLAPSGFITPMAAVAGSVADTICDALWSADLDRLIVNNGGDIAFRLGPGAHLTVALGDVASGTVGGAIRIDDTAEVGGIATSGRGGRSLTMGIADSVTVFAATAAVADAAATLIASNTDLPGHPAIRRCPAADLDASSDLGARTIVTGVGELRRCEQQAAVDRGATVASRLQEQGLLTAAAIRVGEVTVAIGTGRHRPILDGSIQPAGGRATT